MTIDFELIEIPKERVEQQAEDSFVFQNGDKYYGLVQKNHHASKEAIIIRNQKQGCEIVLESSTLSMDNLVDVSLRIKKEFFDSSNDNTKSYI